MTPWVDGASDYIRLFRYLSVWRAHPVRFALSPHLHVGSGRLSMAARIDRLAGMAQRLA